MVGRISAGGTIDVIVFAALFFGLASGVIYLLIRRWLPTGRLGGLTYGALLLVVAATRIDPLRSDNPDFDIVGPGGWPSWCSVLWSLYTACSWRPWQLATARTCPFRLVTAAPSPGTRHSPYYCPLRPSSFSLPSWAPSPSASAGSSRSRRSSDHLAPWSSGAGRSSPAGWSLPGCVSALVDIAGRQP